MAARISAWALREMPVDSYQERRVRLRSGDLLFASGDSGGSADQQRQAGEYGDQYFHDVGSS